MFDHIHDGVASVDFLPYDFVAYSVFPAYFQNSSSGLKVKPSKCVLFQKRINFSGHVISEHGVEPQPEKIEAIREWPRPQCIRDVRAFYGLASYYRRFVRGFAAIAEPLTKLTRKNQKFEWTDESQIAFDKLKVALEYATTLSYPYPNLPCIADSDASDVAIGAVLSLSLIHI